MTTVGERRSSDAHRHIIYQSPQSINEILTRDLLQLSLRDRNKIDEEVHGVYNLAPSESPEFLEKSLRELSVELDNIPKPFKAKFLESQTFPNTYVNTPSFRLRFLRCELFDAPRAATRMCRFLDMASELFGTEALRRPLRLSDLTTEEKDDMVHGNVLQMLPFRDRSGRPVYFLRGRIPNRSMDRLRVNFFVCTTTSDDLESQQKGTVVVIHGSKQPHTVAFKDAGSSSSSRNQRVVPTMQHFIEYKRMNDAIPVRWVAFHFCFPNTPYFQSIRAAYALLSPNYRSVMKFHMGESLEQFYHLKTYGIPVELFPIEENGNITKPFLQQRMRGQKLVETNQGESIIIFPGSHDVLYRRGTSLISHPGNSMFRNYIEAIVNEHTKASHSEKKALTESVIQTVRGHGGRFLEWNTKGWWEELGDPSKVHKKVANQVKLFKFRPKTAQASLRSSTEVFQNQDNAKRRRIASDSEGSGSDKSCGSACFF